MTFEHAFLTLVLFAFGGFFVVLMSVSIWSQGAPSVKATPRVEATPARRPAESDLSFRKAA